MARAAPFHFRVGKGVLDRAEIRGWTCVTRRGVVCFLGIFGSAAGLAAPWYQTPEGRSRGEECAEAPLPRTRKQPGHALRHGGGRRPNGAEGAQANRSADVANETSTERIASPLRTADAVPARQNVEEAAASDNPGQEPPMPAEASNIRGQVPPKPANWGQMTKKAKHSWKQRQKRSRSSIKYGGSCITPPIGRRRTATSRAGSLRHE